MYEILGSVFSTVATTLLSETGKAAVDVVAGRVRTSLEKLLGPEETTKLLEKPDPAIVRQSLEASQANASELLALKEQFQDLLQVLKEHEDVRTSVGLRIENINAAEGVLIEGLDIAGLADIGSISTDGKFVLKSAKVSAPPGKEEGAEAFGSPSASDISASSTGAGATTLPQSLPDPAIPSVPPTHVSINSITINAVSSHSQLDHAEQNTPMPEVIIDARAFEEQLIKTALKPAQSLFMANADYIMPYDFVGREKDLKALNDWASPSATAPVMAISAIGGMGKSMLAWHWLESQAFGVRADWRGRIWYTFGEEQASIDEFTCLFLGVATGVPIHEIHEQLDLAARKRAVLTVLKRSPWLIVFDGIERLLVQWHRPDAVQFNDDAIEDIPHSDQRQALETARPDDGTFLRQLLTISDSRVLLTTRILPSELVNEAGKTLRGVQELRLEGLAREDAVALAESCGIIGNKAEMGAFFEEVCGRHPLAIGIIAGAINNHHPDPGDFESWRDSHAGRRYLGIRNSPLAERLKRILEETIGALDATPRKLLEILSPLPGSVEFGELESYSAFLGVSETGDTSEISDRAAAISEPIATLIHNGLLIRDRKTRRYDMHPTVRWATKATTESDREVEIKSAMGDYFARPSRFPGHDYKTRADLEMPVFSINALLNAEQFELAWSRYHPEIFRALRYQFEDYKTQERLLSGFFPGGQTTPEPESEHTLILNSMAMTKGDLFKFEEAFLLNKRNCDLDFQFKDIRGYTISLLNTCDSLHQLGRRRSALKLNETTGHLAQLLEENGLIFSYHLQRFVLLNKVGQFDQADRQWAELDPMGRDWSVNFYRPGTAEVDFAWSLFQRDQLTADILNETQSVLDQNDANQSVKSRLLRLKCLYLAEEEDWPSAFKLLTEVVTRQRSSGCWDPELETQLLRSRLKIGEFSNPAQELSTRFEGRPVSNIALAELWADLDDPGRAINHAKRAKQAENIEGDAYADPKIIKRVQKVIERVTV